MVFTGQSDMTSGSSAVLLLRHQIHSLRVVSDDDHMSPQEEENGIVKLKKLQNDTTETDEDETQRCHFPWFIRCQRLDEQNCGRETTLSYQLQIG